MAVCYPLKSSIWVTKTRAFSLWCLTSLTLFLVHLSSAKIAKISLASNQQQYCSLSKEKNPIIIDILTASILPIGRLSLFPASRLLKPIRLKNDRQQQ